MYSNPKIPAPFCGKSYKNQVSAPSKVPICKNDAPIHMDAISIKDTAESNLSQKCICFNPAPLLAVLFLELLSEKKEG